MAGLVSHKISWNEYRNVIVDKLYSLYKGNMLLDVRIICEQETIYAHRAVLAAASGYFMDKMRSLETNGIVDIYLDSTLLCIPFTANDVRALVEYMYRGEIAIEQERIHSVVSLGKQLQIIGFQVSLQDLGLDACLSSSCPPSISSLEGLHLHAFQKDSSTIGVYPPPNSTTSLSVDLIQGLDLNSQNTRLTEVPKLCEQMKSDMHIPTHTPISNMSFSELCFSVPSSESCIPIGTSSLAQPKHQLPTLFEHPIQQEDPTKIMGHNSFGSEVIREEESQQKSCESMKTAIAMQELSMEDIAFKQRNKFMSEDTLQRKTEELNNTNDMTTSTGPEECELSILEELTVDSSHGIDSDDVENILVKSSDYHNLSSSQRKRQSKNRGSIARVRLKVKDSIGGVSLHDTSQRLSEDINYMSQTSFITGETHAIVDETVAKKQELPEDSLGIETVACHELGKECSRQEILPPVSQLSTNGSKEHITTLNSLSSVATCEQPTLSTSTLSNSANEENSSQTCDGQKKTSEENGNGLGCPECHARYITLDSLTVHMWRSHSIGSLLKCQLCSYETPVNTQLVQHALSHMGQDKSNVCGVCKKTFKTRATLRTHMKVHQGEEFMHKCHVCPTMYTQRHNLIKHMAASHQLTICGKPLQKALSCPHCAFTTLVEHTLKAHKVRHHTIDKPHKCPECPYSTVEKTALTKHLRTHTNERPFVCEICGL
ncbi:uncharacterized protein LOC143038860 isoform X2 [Oratosquilla oratoria]